MRHTSLTALKGQKILGCPACGQRIKGVWHADPIEGIRFCLVSERDEEVDLSRWLEQNRSHMKTEDDQGPSEESDPKGGLLEENTDGLMGRNLCQGR